MVKTSQTQEHQPVNDVDSGNVRGGICVVDLAGSSQRVVPENSRAGRASPLQEFATAGACRLLIAFILVEPVLGAGEVFRPITEVELPAPRLCIGGLPI